MEIPVSTDVILCHQALSTLQQAGDVSTPTLQRFFTFCKKLVALIHGGDT